jgi:glutamate--cysteine ligase
VPLAHWADELLESLAGICELLDAGDPSRPYGRALAQQREKLAQPELTPSARMLRELRANGESFAALALRESAAHQAQLLGKQLRNAAREQEFAGEAAASLEDQARIEATETGSFEDFLSQQLSSYATLGPAAF